MDKRDAEKVIQDLQTKPFICSDDCLLLDNGYVVLRKEYFEELINIFGRTGERLCCPESGISRQHTDYLT